MPHWLTVFQSTQYLLTYIYLYTFSVGESKGVHQGPPMTQRCFWLDSPLFSDLAHGVEHRPHWPVVREPVAAAALVPGLHHPIPAPKDTVAPANHSSNSVSLLITLSWHGAIRSIDV